MSHMSSRRCEAGIVRQKCRSNAPSSALRSTRTVPWERSERRFMTTLFYPIAERIRLALPYFDAGGQAAASIVTEVTFRRLTGVART